MFLWLGVLMLEFPVGSLQFKSNRSSVVFVEVLGFWRSIFGGTTKGLIARSALNITYHTGVAQSALNTAWYYKPRMGLLRAVKMVQEVRLTIPMG